jgi:hypothetical protein
VRSIKTPADAGDFETTMSRPPADVVEFSVKASGSDLIVQVLEPGRTGSRPQNVGYRIVYVPSSVLGGLSVAPSQFGALADLGDTVAYLSAMNDGGRQQVTVVGRSADRGWYLCVPVGQRGVTATPTGLVRSPWGT